MAVQTAGLRFPAGQTITLYWDTVTPADRLGQVVADVRGAFQASIAVPAAASPGGHNIIAQYSGVLLAECTAPFRVLISPTIQILPGRGPRGTRIAVALSGLNGNGAVTLYWDGERLLGPIPLAGATTWRGDLIVPLSASTGAHTVYAVNTILGRPITRAGAPFEVLPGPPPSPTPSPTPWPLSVQAPARAILGQPLAVNGRAAPGEQVGIGLFGRWSAEEWGQAYEGMPVLNTVTADSEGRFSTSVDTSSITTAGAGQTDTAVGVASLRGPSFGGITELDIPTADVTGYVTYGSDRLPASWADVRANTEQFFIYEDQANRDGYYQLFLWDEVAAGQATTADLPFPPLPGVPGGDLRPGPPLFPAVIYATHRETDEDGNLVAYRWSDTLPFDVRPGEQRRIDIHLNHEVLAGPAVTSVTASLDATRDTHTFGTFLSLLSLYEHAYQERAPVWNTFTAAAEPITPSTEVSRVEFRLADMTVTDQTPGNGWTARFDMSELPAGEHELRVVAFDEYGVISAEPWEGTVIVWEAAKRNLEGWLDEWDINWSEAQKKYEFRATVPEWSPLWEEDLELPLLGTLENRLAADVAISETFTISGTWQAEALFTMDATLLDIDVLEALGVEETERRLNPVSYSRDDARYHGRPNYYEAITKTWTLFSEEQTLYNGIVATYPPWVTIRVRIDFGVDGRLTLSGNLEAEDGAPSVRLSPALGAHVDLDFAADLLMGVGTVGVRATPRFLAEFPLVLQASEPYFYVDSPCARFVIEGRAYVELFWGLGHWETGRVELLDVSFPEGCSPAGWSRALASAASGDGGSGPPFSAGPAQPVEPPRVMAAPAVAADGFGHALAVWIEDRAPGAGEPNPEVLASTWDGAAWSSATPITANDRWETDPRVVFLAPDRGLALWTQNTLPRDAASDPGLDFDDVLSAQELYWSIWDGATWSAAVRLTNNSRPDGRAALAADPATGRALAAWVHDEDGLRETTGDWEIYAAAWNGTGWTAPAAISPSPAAELQVELAFDHAGRAWAVWASDADGNVANETTTSDRRAVYAVWDGARWSQPVAPAEWATGVLYPAVAFDSVDNPLVIYTARGRRPSGELGGLGDDFLYAAYRRGGSWQVASIGVQTPAERPRVVVDNGDRAVVLYRGFGSPESDSFTGEVAVAVADLTRPTLIWGPPSFLTHDARTDWQVAFDVDRGTGDLHALAVKREAGNAAHATAADLAMMVRSGCPACALLTTDAAAPDTPYALGLMAAPDLALSASDIAVSNTYPLAQTIAISATVRNAGLMAAPTAFTVRFLQGGPEGGTPIGERIVPAGLAPGATATVSVPWAPPAGLHAVTIIVDTGDAVAESDESNNVAAADLGRPPAPRLLTAARSPDSGHVLLTWKAPPVSGIAGYRVYRGAASSGPYELIGLAAGTVFEDWVGPRLRQIDFYVVEAFDQTGVRSAYSVEAAARPWQGRRLFLPLVRTR